MNIYEGITQFSKKGSSAMLKKLRQLHTEQALLPIMRDNMLYEDRKKTLDFS